MTVVGGCNLVTWIRASQQMLHMRGNISSIHITLYGIAPAMHVMGLSIIQPRNPQLWSTTNGTITIKLLGSSCNVINPSLTLLFARNATMRLGRQEPKLMVRFLFLHPFCACFVVITPNWTFATICISSKSSLYCIYLSLFLIQ